MTAAPIQIKRAITSLIASLASPIVPTSTLDQDASAPQEGDTTLTIEPLLDTLDRSRFLVGGRLRFYDDTTERDIEITGVSPDGATITLRDPLTANHANTTLSVPTKVYSNLLDYSPEVGAIGRMLVLGDPVVSMAMRQKRTNQDGTQNAQYPVFAVTLMIVRQFSKPADDPRDALSFARDQEDADMEEATAIEKALLANNQTLVTAFAKGCAVKFAPLGSSNDLIVTTWDYQPAEGNVWEFLTTLELRIVGYPPHIA